jgi:hypothetical protein
MYRAKHQADPLSWDADLAAGSQAWSDNCAFQHSNPNGAYGENLAMGHNSFVDAVDDWYNEVRAWARGRGRGASGRGGGGVGGWGARLAWTAQHIQDAGRHPHLSCFLGLAQRLLSSPTGVVACGCVSVSPNAEVDMVRLMPSQSCGLQAYWSCCSHPPAWVCVAPSPLATLPPLP